MATTVGSVALIAKIDTGNYKKGVDEIEKANQRVEGSTGKTDNALARLARNGLKTAAVGFAGLATVIAGMTIKGGISRALNIEDAQAKLKGLGHDTESVTSIMDSALRSVKGTAYGLDEAATIAATAVAAGVKPGKELTKYLSLTADAATIAGVSLDEMGSVFGRVQTNQRAYTEELNQLADRGIPIYQWLQEELGVSAEAMRKMVADGEVDSATYFRVIQKNIGGAALESGKTTRGAYQNLLAALSRIGERIVKGPIDSIRKGFGDLTRWIDDNADTIVNVVQTSFGVIGNTINTTISIIKTLMPVIISSTTAWAAYKAAVIAVNTVQQLQAVYAAATSTKYLLLNGSLITVRGATVAQTLAQTALNTAMKLSPIGLLTGAIVGITTAYALSTNQTDRNKDATVRLKDARNQLKDATNRAKDAENMLKDAQLGAEGAALRVEGAQRNYNDALRNYGPKSYEARVAAHELKSAQEDLKKANQQVKDEANKAIEAQNKIKDAKAAIIKANDEIAASAHRAAGGYQAVGWQASNARTEASKKPKKTGWVDYSPLNLGWPGGGFASGGFTGRGGVNEPAGIVHRGEYVLTQDEVNQNTGEPKYQGKSIEYNINSIVISSEVDGERWLRRLTGDSEIVSHGLVPQQKYMESA